MFAEPALWWHLRFMDRSLAALAQPAEQQRWFACKLRLLQRVAPAVQSVSFLDEYGLLAFRTQPLPGAWRVGQLLQLLHPDRLQGLNIICIQLSAAQLAAFSAQPSNDADLFAPSLASHLQRFTALERLALRGVAFTADAIQAIASLQRLWLLGLTVEVALPACLLDVLQKLPPLRWLLLGGAPLPAGTVAAVLRHTGLQRLALSSPHAALEDPQPLTSLRHLFDLVLAWGGTGPALMLQPCQFAAGLVQYDLARLKPSAATLQVGANTLSWGPFYFEYHLPVCMPGAEVGH